MPESNRVMIRISSVVYSALLEHASNHHCTSSIETESPFETVIDDDDIYYRFGGAALCEMHKKRYQKLTDCGKQQRDALSQEISILQAINTKDKAGIPGYLRFCNRGYMYFPHQVFLPFLHNVDSIVRKVVNPEGFQEHGDDLVKVCTNHMKEYNIKYLTTEPVFAGYTNIKEFV